LIFDFPIGVHRAERKQQRRHRNSRLDPKVLEHNHFWGRSAPVGITHTLHSIQNEPKVIPRLCNLAKFVAAQTVHVPVGVDTAERWQKRKSPAASPGTHQLLRPSSVRILLGRGNRTYWVAGQEYGLRRQIAVAGDRP
jgi:hypothetical protein